MNEMIKEYVKQHLSFFTKINDLFESKIKNINLYQTYNKYIKHISYNDFWLNDIFSYIKSNNLLFLYLKIWIFNISTNRKLNYKIDIFYKNVNIANDIAIIIALLCVQLIENKYMPMIQSNVLPLNYIQDIYTSLRYNIKFRNFLNFVYGKQLNDYDCNFYNVLHELQEYLNNDRFCLESSSCVKIHFKKTSIIKNEYLQNLEDNVIAGELHWNTVSRFTIDKVVSMINASYLRFKLLYNIYPAFFLVQGWYLDKQLINVLPHTFLHDFANILFEVPELTYPSDSILSYVYGGDKILYSKKRQTRLTDYIEQNYEKTIFYKPAFIVKCDEYGCIYKADKYNELHNNIKQKLLGS